MLKDTDEVSYKLLRLERESHKNCRRLLREERAKSRELRQRIRQLEYRDIDIARYIDRQLEEMQKKVALLEYGITMSHDFYMRIKQSALAKDVLTCAGLQEPPK